MTKMKTNLFYNLLNLWSHFRRRRKIQFVGLLMLSITTAFAETFSIGAVLPFLAALTDPESLYNSHFMQPVLEFFSITSPQEMLFPLTLVFLSAVLFAGGMRLLQLSMNTFVSFSTGAELSVEVYRRTLYQPYSTHLSQNSSAVINALATKVPLITNGTIVPFISMISSGFILVTILLVLLFVDVVVSLSIFSGFGLVYFLIIILSRPILKKNGEVIAKKSSIMIKTMQEGLGGIRDVIIDNAQKLYQQSYTKAVLPLRRAQAINQVIGQSPRYAIEAIGITIIGSFAYFLVVHGDGLGNGLPILGTIVLGAQRMLPALQTIFVSWSSIQGNAAVVTDVLEFLEQPIDETHEYEYGTIPLAKNIVLKNLCFRYSLYGPDVINNVNFAITKGSKVGFIGATGSGKSTLLDIIMGLVKPTEGDLLVDGVAIDEHSAGAWQRNIAHVPQSIFLSDSSIKENIAFGIPINKIDFERVKCAAKQAHIDTLIDSWPDKYNTFVGERGIRLSGGQLQRIGVARALYKKANLIVLDEATSSLDLKTEEKIMNTIDGLDDDLTILIVAHRLSTLSKCDTIVEIKNGVIKSVGGYNEITNNQ